MRSYALLGFVALALALARDARAADSPPAPVQSQPSGTSPTMVLTEQDAQNWQAVPQAMDTCVAGLQLRNDPTVCRGLSTFLAAFASRVQASKQAASPPSPPAAEPPKP